MKALKELLFGGAGGGSPVADAGMLVLRLFAGIAMAAGHGFGKLPPSERFIAGVGEMGFPAPTVFAWAAALSEFAGGVLLALGLATRPAAFFLLGTMCTAGFIRHAEDPFVVKEKAFLYAAIALMFMLAGAGRFSLDALLRGRRGPKP